MFGLFSKKKEIKLKTNINCGNCVAKVRPYLDEEKKIEEWSIDTNSPDKVLKVKGENISKVDVEKIIQHAGYKIKE